LRKLRSCDYGNTDKQYKREIRNSKMKYRGHNGKEKEGPKWGWLMHVQLALDLSSGGIAEQHIKNSLLARE
jgi:hypothetical protein